MGLFVSQIVAQLVRGLHRGTGELEPIQQLRFGTAMVRSQTLYPTELRARSVSPSTIPRCDAKLQLCSPDFVAHVAQLSPAPKCQPWESRSRVPPSPPSLRGTSGSPPTACRTGSPSPCWNDPSSSQ